MNPCNEVLMRAHSVLEEQAAAAAEQFLLGGSRPASVTGSATAEKRAHSEKVEICICLAFLICVG